MPDYLGGPAGVDGALGLEASVVGVAEGAGDTAVDVPVMVWGGSVPGPSGSTTVVGACPGATDGLVSVGLVSGVVVVSGVGVVSDVGVVVVVVVLGWTYVRGTHVYAGSGTNPGGTTRVSGAAGAGGRGWYSLCSQAIARNARIRPTVDVRIRPLTMYPGQPWSGRLRVSQFQRLTDGPPSPAVRGPSERWPNSESCSPRETCRPR